MSILFDELKDEYQSHTLMHQDSDLDTYDVSLKKRMKRSQSWVKEISDDIGYIIDKVDSADYVRLDICRDRSKRYFAIALAKEYKIARDTDIMMTLDNVLEVYNCALECTINKYR